MSDRLRIAIANQPWGLVQPPITRGGSIPVLLYEIATRLANDCDVTYYTRGAFQRHVHREAGIDFEYLPVALDKALIRIQSKVQFFPSTPRKPFWASDRYYRQFGTGLGKSARRRGCQIVHLNNYSQFIPHVRRHHPEARIVMHTHCEWLNQLDHAMVEDRLAQADLVLCVSNFIRDRLRQAQPAHAQRIHTLYNGVNTDRFHPATVDPGSREQRIVFAGRLSPEKGVHILIEAFAALADRRPGVTLDIAGPDEVIPAAMQLDLTDDPEVARLKPLYEPGAYRVHLQKLIRDRGLTDRVKFHGVLDHAGGLVELLQRATLAVIPSIWDEPFGLPVIEAMACGVPVIATRVGAFPELVEEGKTGLLVQRANPEELAAAMDKLLENDAMRREMSQASRQRAVQVFSWDRVVDELRECYRTTIETRAAHTPHLVAR